MTFKWKYSNVTKRLKRLNFYATQPTEQQSETAKQLSQRQTPTNIQKSWTNIDNAITKEAHGTSV